MAQGFRQKAYDSYDPDQTFSPVVHKDSLRMFLSVFAAEGLRVYQADVKAAFLQAPLDEKILLKPPRLLCSGSEYWGAGGLGIAKVYLRPEAKFSLLLECYG